MRRGDWPGVGVAVGTGRGLGLVRVGTLCSLWYGLAVNIPMRRVFGRGFAGTSMNRNLLPVFHRVSFPEESLSRSSIKLERILTPRDLITFIISMLEKDIGTFPMVNLVAGVSRFHDRL